VVQAVATCRQSP